MNKNSTATKSLLSLYSGGNKRLFSKKKGEAGGFGIREIMYFYVFIRNIRVYSVFPRPSGSSSNLD